MANIVKSIPENGGSVEVSYRFSSDKCTNPVVSASRGYSSWLTVNIDDVTNKFVITATRNSSVERTGYITPIVNGMRCGSKQIEVIQEGSSVVCDCNNISLDPYIVEFDYDDKNVEKSIEIIDTNDCISSVVSVSNPEYFNIYPPTSIGASIVVEAIEKNIGTTDYDEDVSITFELKDGSMCTKEFKAIQHCSDSPYNCDNIVIEPQVWFDFDTTTPETLEITVYEGSLSAVSAEDTEHFEVTATTSPSPAIIIQTVDYNTGTIDYVDEILVVCTLANGAECIKTITATQSCMGECTASRITLRDNESFDYDDLTIHTLNVSSPDGCITSVHYENTTNFNVTATTTSVKIQAKRENKTSEPYSDTIQITFHLSNGRTAHKEIIAVQDTICSNISIDQPSLINYDDLSVKTINITDPRSLISLIRADDTEHFYIIETGIAYIKIQAKAVNEDIKAHTDTVSVICTLTDGYECTKTFDVTQLNS